MYIVIALLAFGSICRAAGATREIQTMQWTFEKEKEGGIPAGAAVFTGNWAARVDLGLRQATQGHSGKFSQGAFRYMAGIACGS